MELRASLHRGTRNEGEGVPLRTGFTKVSFWELVDVRVCQNDFVSRKSTVQYSPYDTETPQ